VGRVPGRRPQHRLPFTRWETTALESLAMLAQDGHRCGVYVLEFDDGTRYVGQARDVVRRYADHRRGHSRAGRAIRAVEFTEVTVEDLNRVEQQMIAHEGLRGPIRNNRHAATMAGPSRLDPVIAVDDQLAWLNSTVPEGWNEAGPRTDHPEQRVKGSKRYKQLLAHPLGESACAVMQDYIAETIPRPRQTERRFWAVSAVPATSGGRLATLSVGKMETMFLYAEPDEEHKGEFWDFGGCINVAGSLVGCLYGPRGQSVRKQRRGPRNDAILGKSGV